MKWLCKYKTDHTDIVTDMITDMFPDMIPDTDTDKYAIKSSLVIVHGFCLVYCFVNTRNLNTNIDYLLLKRILLRIQLRI